MDAWKSARAQSVLARASKESERSLPQHQFKGGGTRVLTDVHRPAGVDVWLLTWSFFERQLNTIRSNLVLILVHSVLKGAFSQINFLGLRLGTCETVIAGSRSATSYEQ